MKIVNLNKYLILLFSAALTVLILGTGCVKKINAWPDKKTVNRCLEGFDNCVVGISGELPSEQEAYTDAFNHAKLIAIESRCVVGKKLKMMSAKTEAKETLNSEYAKWAASVIWEDAGVKKIVQVVPNLCHLENGKYKAKVYCGVNYFDADDQEDSKRQSAAAYIAILKFLKDEKNAALIQSLQDAYNVPPGEIEKFHMKIEHARPNIPEYLYEVKNQELIVTLKFLRGTRDLVAYDCAINKDPETCAEAESLEQKIRLIVQELQLRGVSPDQ